MFRRSCCPRCKGDVRLDRDEYGWYEECLMCGYMHDLEGTVTVDEHDPAHFRYEPVRVRHAD